MLSAYLNSLYDFIRYQNPFIQMWDFTKLTARVLWNLRGNMKLVRQKQALLDNRLLRIQDNVDYAMHHTTPRFDVRR